MIFLISTVFVIPFYFIGYNYFKKIINPISIYLIIWYTLINLYYIKLISYIDLSIEAWVLIISTFLSFFLGCITVFIAQKSLLIKANEKNNKEGLNLFKDNGKTIKEFALFFSFLGLLGAIQQWYVLINLYGSLAKALLNLGWVYHMRVSGELPGVIPYLSSTTYIGIFLSGLYTGWKGQFSWIGLIPIVASVLSGIASVARASILFGIVEFILVTMFSIYYFNNFDKDRKTKFSKIIISFTIIISLFVLSAAIIRSLRGNDEIMVGQTRSITQLKENAFITPSIYLYLSGHIGVLTRYLESTEGEETRVGENTFLFVYNTLNKFDVVRKPNGYQKGYYIPEWMNTGTYIRELHADFGTGGLLFFVYLLGFMISFSWFKAINESKIIYLVPLTYFSIIIVFSFLMIITRLGVWIISFLSIMALFPILNKIIFMRTKIDIQQNG
ncbi:MAG: oligosaccharide repeat unit polymerase [Ignavibacteria bacterium]|nr:oligosaccharide repeat unit polymerase [Ignavibacteria bacterium]